MRAFLKARVVGLVAESRALRAQAVRLQKARTQVDLAERHSLCEQRLFVIRPASRAAHLAYGFLRGRSYPQMELHTKPWGPVVGSPKWQKRAPLHPVRVALVSAWEIVVQFGCGSGPGLVDIRVMRQRWAEWLEDVPVELRP